MDPTPNEATIYRLLGELSADMKHVLRALEQNKKIASEMREEINEDIGKLKERLDKVEKFNIRVLAYASVAAPVLLFGFQFAATYLTGG